MGFRTLLIVLFILPSITFATTYNVRQDGTGNFATIQACANAAQAGDTCLVSAGSYNEYVSVANSGTSGNLINFQASGNVKMAGFSINGKNYIRIQGFEITSTGFSNAGNYAVYLLSTTGIQVLDNYIHNTLSTCISLRYSGPSTRAIIRNNTISYCGYAGMEIVGNYNLVDGNDISHADNFIQLYGSNNVIRNNIFHDVSLSDWATPGDPHIDGIETSPSAGDPPHIRNVIEGNYMYNGVDANTHFMLLRNSQNAVQVSDQIIRYNTLSNIGSGFIALGGVGSAVDIVTNTKIYGNTIVNDAVATLEYTDNVVCATCPGTKIINNIYYNNVLDNGFVFYLASSPDPGFYASNNLDYLSSCGASCAWRSTTFPYINTILNQNPLFLNAANNFNLQAGSPAIETGGQLTNVSSLDTGSGTSLVVGDAGMFQDGQGGIVNPDWIAVGSATNTVQITSINYATNTITLASPVTRSYGSPVYLYKDSSGRQVLYGNKPDIGAFEYAAGTTYTVKKDGTGNFNTIQACANAAQAGDTCTVYAGTYNEYVMAARAGTPSNRITYTVNGQDNVKVLGWTLASYVTVSGFEVTDPTFSYPNAFLLNSGTTGAWILNNNIHEAGIQQAIRFALTCAGCSYNVIRGNTISWAASHPAPPCISNCGDGGAGVIVNGDHTLVENNDISHVTDFISAYGSFNVIRNNTFHDVRITDFPSTSNNLHVDGVETDCSSTLAPLVHAVYEGNSIENNLVANGHFWLVQDEGACGSNGLIIRFNRGHNVASYGLIDTNDFTQVKNYNNNYIGVGPDGNFESVDRFGIRSTYGAELNNIFYDSPGPNVVSSSVYEVDADSTAGFVGGHNLAYCTGMCSYTGRIVSDTGNIRGQNPLFVNAASDWHLQAGSPASDAGTYLTTVANSDTGSGTTLTVNDAGFFQYGYGIVNADWIAVGTAGNIAQISSINYATNTITLASPITRSSGNPVYLYKDSTGRQVLYGNAPDIGAYEFIGGVTDTTPPTVAITSPAGGIAPGTITVSATASDNVGVAGVQFKVDGNNVGAEDTTTPYSISWDSTTVTNGTHSITATARDAAGNTATSSAVNVNVQNAAASCTTSSTSWLNTPIQTQAGIFTAGFDATPNAANIDAVNGFSVGQASAFGDLATIARFSSTSGMIDARNGSLYDAMTNMPFSAGTKYHFRMAIDVPQRRYSVWVTPLGQIETMIASNFSFRSEQSTAISLGNWVIYSQIGTEQVCNFSIDTSPQYSGIILRGRVMRTSSAACPACLVNFTMNGVNGMATTASDGTFMTVLATTFAPGTYNSDIIITDGATVNSFKKRIVIA